MNAGQMLLDEANSDDPLEELRMKAALKDNVTLHFRIVKGCFEDCCDDFTHKRLGREERKCVETCFGKMIAQTLSAGQLFAEEQARLDAPALKAAAQAQADA